MRVFGERFLVVGLSRSGIAATKLLLRHGAEVFLFDQYDSARIEEVKRSLISLGAHYVEKEGLERVISSVSVVVLSPGIAIDNPIAVFAHEKEKRVIGELELGSMFLSSPMIAVTGTNGKTTTVSMIGEILRAAAIPCETVGNIGVPLSDKAESIPENGFAVTEVSSFQLETVFSFTPHIAVLLNISEDHLNRHYTMDNYVYLKKRMFRNLKESEFAVLNAEDDRAQEIAETTRAKVFLISSNKRVNGAYLAENAVWFNDERLFPVERLALKEKHNVENALAAVTVAKILHIENSVIENALASFRGARHRMELVCTKDGVTYINDSKATNTDAALSAIRAVKRPTVLLVGGSDKGYSYRTFFGALKDSVCRYAVLYGENREKLLADCRAAGFYNYSVVECFSQAVKVASTVAKSGEVVLLSPASASFDEFDGYDERGDAFIRIVTGKEDEKPSS